MFCPVFADIDSVICNTNFACTGSLTTEIMSCLARGGMTMY